jgi:hypothetical protein
MSTTQNPVEEVAASSDVVNELFHGAMLEYEKALKSGIQFQQHAAGLWKDLLARCGTPTAFQTALDSASSEAFPNAYKYASEFVEICSMNVMLANRAGSQVSDLFGKALGVYQSGSIAEAQVRSQDVIERSFAALRAHVHTVLNANTRAIGLWKSIADTCATKGFNAIAQSMEEKPLSAA